MHDMRRQVAFAEKQVPPLPPRRQVGTETQTARSCEARSKRRSLLGRFERRSSHLPEAMASSERGGGRFRRPTVSFPLPLSHASHVAEELLRSTIYALLLWGCLATPEPHLMAKGLSACIHVESHACRRLRSEPFRSFRRKPLHLHHQSPSRHVVTAGPHLRNWSTTAARHEISSGDGTRYVRRPASLDRPTSLPRSGC